MTLPTFVIVGAMRSGSTSLFKYLQDHPDVWMPHKETHFFDVRWDRGVEWYRTRFAGHAGQRAIGEATPSYLADTAAVERIATTLPEARLLAVLREPVARAYSHYWMEHARGRDDRAFEAAAPDYLARGRYVEQLERLAALVPRELLHVVLFDDLRDHPAETYAAVCRFLGIDEQFVPARLGERVNDFMTFRSDRLRTVQRRLPKRFRIRRAIGVLNARRGTYPPLDPALAARLRAGFGADNDALARWLGRPLPAAWGPTAS